MPVMFIKIFFIEIYSFFILQYRLINFRTWRKTVNPWIGNPCKTFNWINYLLRIVKCILIYMLLKYWLYNKLKHFNSYYVLLQNFSLKINSLSWFFRRLPRVSSLWKRRCLSVSSNLAAFSLIINLNIRVLMHSFYFIKI